jgi:hypothetical protein
MSTNERAPAERRWQLRTWTKGTGAVVEPRGARDAPPARAMPGGLTPLPPPGARRRGQHDRPAGAHVTSDDAARRLAARHLSEETISALLALRERLAADERP